MMEKIQIAAQSFSNWWYGSSETEDVTVTPPREQTDDQYKKRKTSEARSKKKRKGKAVKKKGESPAGPLPTARTLRTDPRLQSEVPKSVSLSAIKESSASGSVQHVNPLPTYSHNSSAVPPRQNICDRREVDDGSDDDDEGEDSEQENQMDFSEVSEDDDESTDGWENSSEQSSTRAGGDKEDDESWFEKSEKAAREERHTEGGSKSIKLSDEQISKLKRGSEKRNIYREFIKHPRRLLKSEPTRYKRCQMKIESSQRSTAIVLDSSPDCSEIIIDGRSKAGRTYMDDEVVVEILSEPSGKRHLKQQKRKVCSRADIAHSMEGKVYGQVVGLLNRVQADYPVMFCTLDETEIFLMKPLCRTVPKIHIMNDGVRKKFPDFTQTRIDKKRITSSGNIEYDSYFEIEPDKRQQYVFKVLLVEWTASYHYPLGIVLEMEEDGAGYSSQLRVLTMKHHVPTYFPRDVVEETKKLCQQAVPSQPGREDLIGERIFTIDGPDSKDLDDAISIKKEGSHYTVAIHISDVASVIKKDSRTDVEARRRGTTFYPLDRRPYPMLPEKLGHDQCSLLPGKQRLAFSLSFQFDKDGNQTKKEPVLKKSVIRSCQQLTYEQVQKVIDTLESPQISQPMQNDIGLLHMIADKLRRDRKKDSILFIPFHDPRLCDVETMAVHRDAHALIEELMILTNSYIVSRLSKNDTLRKILLLQCQKAPSMDKLREWENHEEQVNNLIIQLQGQTVSSGRQLSFCHIENKQQGPACKSDLVIQKNVWHKLCQYLEQGEKEKARTLAFTDALHPLQFLAAQGWIDLMETAEYKCYDMTRDRRHFALNLNLYTHCTSPIRRYADLYVQRLLHADLDGEVLDCCPGDVMELCHQLNDARSRQKAFGKASGILKFSKNLQHQPLVQRAYVDSVDEEQIRVAVPSLAQFSRGKQTVPFNMLGISCQPDVTTDTALQQDSVTVQWRKRLYRKADSHCTTIQRSANRPASRTIRPDQLSVQVKRNEWMEILKTLKSDGLSVCPQMERRMQAGIDYVSSEDACTPSRHPVEFQRVYTRGQVLQLQMSAAIKSGMVTLHADIVHVTRNVKICTQHVRAPVPTLCRWAKQSIRSQDFSSCREYIKAWTPLVEMEAAVTAGHSQDGIVIENIVTSLQKEKQSFTGSLSLGVKFCHERGIELGGGKSVDSIRGKKSRTRSSFALDYFLCLRYTLECPERVLSRIKQSDMSVAVDKHYTWLAHGKVVSVVHKHRKAEDGGLLEVTFDLSSSNTSPPDQLLTKDGASLTVELLPKSDHFRRAQEMLVQLKDPKQTLARAIALGSEIPPLDSDLKKAAMMLISRCGTDVTRQGNRQALPPNNDSQTESIHRALTNSLALIQGPPGTGKTNVGIKLVWQFCQINRSLQMQGQDKGIVMFCGPSNQSVDLVAREMLNKLGEECPSIVRVYGAIIENQDYPVPGHYLPASKDPRGTISDSRIQNISLHHVIRQRGKPHADKIRSFDRLFKGSARVSLEDVNEYRKVVFMAKVQELKNYQCVLATCAVAASQKVLDAIHVTQDEEERTTVSQLIIDESGMCPQPQSMAPIIATNAKQVVLIGDHQQLKPVVKCKQAADMGLDQSLFERLHRHFPGISVFLNYQYRMHPAICQFPSTQFYEGVLETRPTTSVLTWNVKPLPFWPLRRPQLPPDENATEYERHLQEARQAIPHLLVDVRGKEVKLTASTEEGNDRSRSNDMEANKVMEILGYLKKVHKISLEKVVVLTQYKAQKCLIEDKVRKACETSADNGFDRDDKVTLLQDKRLVNTVVSSQGGEWDYVVLSTVRSLPSHMIEGQPTIGWCLQKLGFIIDYHQANVALTRARRGLIIVGNAELLKCDDIWRKLVESYEKDGCVLNSGKFPPK